MSKCPKMNQKKVPECDFLLAKVCHGLRNYGQLNSLPTQDIKVKLAIEHSSN